MKIIKIVGFLTNVACFIWNAEVNNWDAALGWLTATVLMICVIALSRKK